MKTPSEMAEYLAKTYATHDPYRLAKELNIPVYTVPLGSQEGFSGTYKKSPFILINEEVDENRQYFICAHELGHCMLHRKKNMQFLNRFTLQSIDRLENEANEFARALLLPLIEDPYNDVNFLLQ